MQHTAYRLGEYKIIEYEHGDLWWETHIGLGSSKSGKCFINGDILFLKPSGSMGPGFLKGEFLDHLQFQMNLLGVLFNMDNTQYIKVWDIAIRVFHWTLVGCYALAFISSENIPKSHVFFGYSVLFLVLFRILYGFVGTKYARFSDFLYQPAQIVDYLKGLLIRRPKHYIGHNPAGGFMIIILLLSLLSLTLTGLKAYGVKGHGLLAKHEISFMTNAFADSDDKKNNDEHASRKRLSQKNHRTEKNEKDEFWEEVHETIAHFTLFLISIHILGVLVSSLVHRENLIKAMITGRKRLV